MRPLDACEIGKLKSNNNTSDNWQQVIVTDKFNPQLVRGCRFYGWVRIGDMDNCILEFHDLPLTAGLYNSTIANCVIGANVVVDNVKYLGNYVLADETILFNIGEMLTTNHACFGYGIIRDYQQHFNHTSGHTQNHTTERIWMALGNETETRKVAPFAGMLTADAFMWAKYRHDKKLMQRLEQMTQQQFQTDHINNTINTHNATTSGNITTTGINNPTDNNNSVNNGTCTSTDNSNGNAHNSVSPVIYYGTVGTHTVIKNCRSIKDVNIGPHTYIKGANKLKNLTIASTARQSTQIGEGVELVNGIINPGCHIFYGSKAVRFVMGPNCSLKYGARLINSFLGDNSTISCCEVLNSLIFPGHEQHHNNSFLCAAMVLGQSNIAAGVTAGSNHNSRANDGELLAGRGFWPGLCASIKHNSRFASFTLLAKGSYPAELNITLPFSLVSNDVKHDRLLVMPGYWFMYNMYALARNSWKYKHRDKRIRYNDKPYQHQIVEFTALAPDTIEEIFTAMELLEIWTAHAANHRGGRRDDHLPTEQLSRQGRELLQHNPGIIDNLDVYAKNMENSRRDVRILKVRQGYEFYRRMVHYYAINTLMNFMYTNNLTKIDELIEYLSLCPSDDDQYNHNNKTKPDKTNKPSQWVNLGGQLVRNYDLETIKQKIRTGQISSWDNLHQYYHQLHNQYPLHTARYALNCLLKINNLSLDNTNTRTIDTSAENFETKGTEIHNNKTNILTPETWANCLDRAANIQKLIAQLVYESRQKDYENPYRHITFDSPEEADTILGHIEQNEFIAQINRQTETFLCHIQQMKDYALQCV